MHDEIDAKGQRKLIEARRKRVVRDDDRALRMGERRHGSEVRQRHGRVGRRFRVDEAGLRTDRLGKRLDVGLVDLRDLDALPRQPFREQGERRGVMRFLRDDMIAGAHMAQDRSRNRRDAGTGRDRALGPLEIGDNGLDMRNIGRAVAGVETLRMPARRNLGPEFRRRQDVGRGLVDGGRDGFAAWRRLGPRMLKPGLDPASLFRHRIALP